MEKHRGKQSDNSLPKIDNIRKSEFTVFENVDYIKQIEELVPQAKQRVWIQTMAFDGHGPFLKLKDLLENAATRGVDAQFTTDTYYKLILSGSLYYAPRISKAKRKKISSIKAEKENVLSELEQNNVPVTITNPPQTLQERINPARGRNHVKMAIIDDIAFMGDINNLVSKNQPGIMIKVTDPLLVESLADLYQAAEKGKGDSDYEVIGKDGTSLLVDMGDKHQSLILDRAMAAIDSADSSVKITSQFTPDGAILQSLQAAHERGVKISTLIAGPEKITRPLPKIFDKRSQLAFKKNGFTIPILEVPDWIHAKILLVDEDLPNAQGIVGTHCFSGKGVDWGTQEIALQSKNPSLLKQLRRYVGNLEAQAAQRDTQKTVRKIIFPE